MPSKAKQRPTRRYEYFDTLEFSHEKQYTQNLSVKASGSFCVSWSCLNPCKHAGKLGRIYDKRVSSLGGSLNQRKTLLREPERKAFFASPILWLATRGEQWRKRRAKRAGSIEWKELVHSSHSAQDWAHIAPYILSEYEHSLWTILLPSLTTYSGRFWWLYGSIKTLLFEQERPDFPDVGEHIISNLRIIHNLVMHTSIVDGSSLFMIWLAPLMSS